MVNSKELFEPELFVKATINEHIEAGTSSFPILGHSTRMIRKALNSAIGPVTIDFILKDIVVIEGFYINIVLEACFC